jgi:hypothetical protein
MKHVLQDLTGKRFTRLTITAHLGATPNRHTQYLAVCDCGTQTTVLRHNLLKGTSRSCGCLRTELRKAKAKGAKGRQSEQNALHRQMA